MSLGAMILLVTGSLVSLIWFGALACSRLLEGSAPVHSVVIPKSQRQDGIVFALTFNLGDRKIREFTNVAAFRPIRMSDESVDLALYPGRYWLFLLPCDVAKLERAATIETIFGAVNSEGTLHSVLRLGRSVVRSEVLPKFSVGQAWTYRTHQEYDDARVIIGQVDSLAESIIVHVQLSGSGGHAVGTVPQYDHIPIELGALERSVVRRVDDVALDIALFEDGHSIWKQAFDAGDAGWFSTTLSIVVTPTETWPD